LKAVAAAKVEQITAELQTPNSDAKFNPVERIKTGFIHFKREKFESVISILFILHISLTLSNSPSDVQKFKLSFNNRDWKYIYILQNLHSNIILIKL
jgi:hypothetical protein